MNKQLWNLYKNDRKRYEQAVNTFNIERDWNECSADIIELSNKTDNALQGLEPLLFLLYANTRENLPQELNRETFQEFIENLKIVDAEEDSDGKITLYENDVILPADNFRRKASLTSIISIFLYFLYEGYYPLLLPRRFDIVQRNCQALGIELPPIPRTKDYKEYLMYYYDICQVWEGFRQANDLTAAELCACIYDFADALVEETNKAALPKPVNVWLTGAAAKGDFAYLDALGQNTEYNAAGIWACNEQTRRGDIIVIYCTTPRSYIHSIWRADSGGIFNPFDYYHCRTTICDGQRVPNITFADLKNDSYFANVPIVRKNLQGVNGVALSSKDYVELLRLIEEKGGDTSTLPRLFAGTQLNFGEIKLEKDVEEKILIPLLRQLGYADDDWVRQLSQKAGRGLKAIPDFVFFPKEIGEKHVHTAPFVVEAKFDMSSAREFRNAFSQVVSYAHMLTSKLFALCDKERLVVYDATNGIPAKESPVFEDLWQSIFDDAEVGGRLAHIIGKARVSTL